MKILLSILFYSLFLVGFVFIFKGVGPELLRMAGAFLAIFCLIMGSSFLVADGINHSMSKQVKEQPESLGEPTNLPY